jgi:hypothetical protein
VKWSHLLWKPNTCFGSKDAVYGFALYLNDINVQVGHTGYSDSKGFTVLNLYYLNSKSGVLITIENQSYEIDKKSLFCMKKCYVI